MNIQQWVKGLQVIFFLFIVFQSFHIVHIILFALRIKEYAFENAQK
jgi:hypothetical protein